MYCRKCGSKILDGNCGTKIDQVDTHTKPRHKRKLKVMLPIVFVGILAIAIGVYFVFFDNFKLEGTYNELSDGNDTYDYYMFTPVDKTNYKIN